MQHRPDDEVLFREVQHLRQFWVWLLVAAISIMTLWSLVQQVILRKPFGTNPAPDSMVIVFAILFGIGVPVFFYYVDLITAVHTDGVFVRFFPFQPGFEKIALEDIASVSIKEYNILDYGGWGIRFSTHGKAYNVSGNQGVLLELRSGRHFLIGSHRAAELARAITVARAKLK